MDVELAKEDIKAARKRIARDSDFISKTRYDIALHLCPFSVGDAVINPEGKKEIIDSISYCSWSRDGYTFKVLKMKNNGDPYKQSTNVYGDLSKYTKAS